MKLLSQTVEVETPELVVVSYTVAGLGSRVAAALIDMLICIVAFVATGLAVAMVLSKFGGHVRLVDKRSTAWVIAFFTIVQFVILWGYYVLFEGLRDGQTPGKRMLRLRVVRDGGYSVGFAASAARNIMRVFDWQPGITGVFGMIGIAFSKSGKRVGDMVAGTIVVREQLIRQPVTPREIIRIGESSDTAESLSTALSEEEFSILERWTERRQTLAPEQRAAITAQVAGRLHHALPTGLAPTATDAARLVRLFETEQRARGRGVAARQQTGAGRERYAIVATRSPRWIAFAATLATAQRSGLQVLGETGVRDFVAEYRALTSDLARLQTAARGSASDELFYLGRLVAAAHNLIYRSRGSDFVDVIRFLWIDVPAEIRRSYAPIGLAVALLFGPAVIAYVAVVRDPQISTVFIPAGMQDRANAGIAWAKNDEGYIPDPEMARPMMASGIVSNNVQVTFLVFAFGVTLGVGTALLLLLNGVSLGGVLGLYQSKGILSLILAFVAPHGVLELSAICIAGGGGFLIAAAMIIPGGRTRRRALAENSRRAMRLIAGSTLLLVAAGSLEGLLSPIPWWPIEVKLAVSGVTAVLLYVYLRSGAGRGTPIITAASARNRVEFWGIDAAPVTEARVTGLPSP